MTAQCCLCRAKFCPFVCKGWSKTTEDKLGCWVFHARFGYILFYFFERKRRVRNYRTEKVTKRPAGIRTRDLSLTGRMFFRLSHKSRSVVNGVRIRLSQSIPSPSMLRIQKQHTVHRLCISLLLVSWGDAIIRRNSQCWVDIIYSKLPENWHQAVKPLVAQFDSLDVFAFCYIIPMYSSSSTSWLLLLCIFDLFCATFSKLVSRLQAKMCFAFQCLFTFETIL